MKKWIAISLLFLASMAFGQSVVITGTVLSPSGQPYSNGNGKAQLQPSNVQWLFGNSPVPSPITIASLDSFGRFSVTLTSTAVIQPQSQGPTWQFSFCSQVYASQTQPVCFTMTPMALTTSQDISTQIQAQSAPLPSSGGGITSLGLSVPQGLSVSPSSLSAPGTFAITWNGTPIPNSAIPDPTSSALGGVESITCTNQFLSAISTLGVPLCTTPSFVSLTTTGTSGAATLSGGVLNIPQYASSGGVVSSTAPFQALYSGTPGSTVTTISGQQKPIYDVRDYGLACNGSTNDTAAMVALRTANTQNAAVAIPVDATHPGPCELGGINLPFTLDFSGGGAIGVIANPATPGNGALVQASPGTAYTGNSCTATLNSAPTAGNAVLMEIIYEFGSGTVPNLPTDSANDSFNVLLQSNLSFESNSTSWAAAAVAGGSASQAITVTLAGASTHGVCFAQEVSGEGTGIAVDPGSTFTYASGSSPYSGPYSVTATLEPGDFVLAYGGQGTNNTTCTQGSGFTQPSSTEGNVNGMCLQYQADSSAGSVNATQTTSPNSFSDYWVYNIVGIRPGTSVVHPQAGIIDPDLHQVFVNATGANGAISFFHNLALSRVYPEWWGGSPPVSAATNTPAIQAAINASFNNGGPAYNKTLDLSRGIYNINAETQWYNVNGNQASRFQVDCGSAGGINQTTANLRIMDSQSMDYGRFDNCVWSSSATDTQTTADLDIDWNGVITPTGQKPQFLDFYSNSFIGNKLRAIGVLGAKSGGAAQFSNINFYDPEFNGFTQAAYQIGTPTVGATNAIENFIWGGDFQGNNDYGIYVIGGNVEVIGTSMENGFSTISNEGAQTGYDLYCGLNQGPCVMQWVRSESMKLVACETCIVEHSYTQDQGSFPTPGGSDPVGAILDGHIEAIAWDGRYYIVTADNGDFGGVGTPAAPLTASGGSTTTITDTNETVAGSVTTGIFTNNENLIQSGTGATATLIGGVASTYTIAGTLTSGTIVFGDVMTQTGTGAHGPASTVHTSTSLGLQSLVGTPNGTGTWVDGTSGAIFTPSAAPVASATSMLITAATGSPNSSATWVGQTSGAVFTPTGTPVNQANWTTNQFVGMAVAVTGPTANNLFLGNQGCYGVVTSNAAQTITLTAGWTTQYNLLNCSSPIAGSQFIVEPNWGSASTLYSCATGSTSACASTGMTFQVVNADGVGTCTVQGCVTAGVQANDVYVPGLTWRVSPSGNSTLKSVIVTPSQWLDDPTDPQGCCVLDRDWDVRRAQSYQLSGQGTFYQNWTLPSIGGVAASAPLQENLGTRQITFSTGQINVGPNLSAHDTSVGGRTDPGAANDITRAHLEFWPSIGPPTPVGTNMNGNNAVFDCGNSTGSGTPGSCEWYVATAGSSGTTPNGGGTSPTYSMVLGPTGLTLGNPTGGGEGAGTLNATGLYVNGVAVGGGFTAGGDLSGTSTSQEVVGVLSHALPSIATGFLNWTGSAWAFSSQYISSLTTTGTSGPATVSGGVLNIPQYAGGGGTGSQYQSAYFSNTNTVGAFGPGITGQVATSQGASSAPAYTSQGLGLGNGGSPVTASTYLVKCDSGTTILDRGTVLVFQSGASAITVPDTGNTGCGAGFAFKIIDDAAGTITISRQTSSTINIANGTTNSDGQTSFTMGNGAFATFSADGSGHYWVTLTQ